MIIKNGLVFNENFQFENKNIAFENNLIIDDDNDNSGDSFDATGMYVIPGLIDTHIHGAMGHDFCDKDVDGLITIAKYLKSKGVTSFCPTSMTLQKNALIDIFETANSKLPEDCSDIVGIHMEGPFLAEEKKGAQNGKYIMLPEVSMFKELNAACNNLIKIITLAPEIKNAMDFIEKLSKDVHISLGHTSANYDLGKKALSLGADRITHLYNAMLPYTHREPGLIGASYEVKSTYVELITDGVHVHPTVINATFDMYGDDRVVLVSDCMMATGMENGEYELGGQKVFVENRKATLSNGTIAGSATNLMDCMINAVKFGIPLEKAVKASTVNAAKSIDIFDEVGSLEVGKKANIVILDKDLNLVKVF